MIPLYRPYMPDLPDMDAILHSGALTEGEHTRKFEKMLSDYFQTPYVLVTNSFHTAISVVVAAFGLMHGDEVITSPMACLASTQPYASGGLKIVWSDVDNTRGTLDPEAVIKRITKRTRLIVHNHFCGYPGYVDAINAIGRDYGIPVIDDGIECFGSEYHNKRIGCCGTDATAFAFTAVRIPNTIDGGGILLHDEATYERARLIRDCGIDRTQFRDARGEIRPECDISMMGYSATMSNVNGYIGCRQMAYVDALLAKQRRNAAAWDERLREEKGITSMPCAEGRPNYWVYGTLADDKQEAIARFRAQGYYASGVHINNDRYSVFGEYHPLPGVEDFYRRFVALPCGWWMD